jgi:DNA-binding response OmpR family regulator
MQDKRVLVIDDDPSLLQFVNLVFAQANAEVYTATNGSDGLHLFYTYRPDLVCLDLMLPEMDGWEICRRIRQVSQVPLIMVTALGQEDEIIRGLETYGADDYVTKPFNYHVLLARAKALLRRAALPPALEETIIYSDDYLTIPAKDYRVFVCGNLIKLSLKEHRLLTYLVQNAGRVLTLQQILENVWDESRDNPEYVHAYIWHLRQKLEVDPRNPVYILTEYGVGYTFEKQILINN